MPSDHRIRANHVQTMAPTGPPSREQDPQEPVGALEAQAPRRVLLENGELVAKRENLRLQCDTGSKTRGYQSEKGDDKRVHRDSTRISRMIGTSAFPARTEFSVTTPRKRESVDHACGPVCDSLQDPAARRHRIRPAARDAGGPTTLRSRRTTRPQTRCTTLSSANSAASRLIKNHSSNHDARYNDFTG